MINWVPYFQKFGLAVYSGNFRHFGAIWHPLKCERDSTGKWNENKQTYFFGQTCETLACYKPISSGKISQVLPTSCNTGCLRNEGWGKVRTTHGTWLWSLIAFFPSYIGAVWPICVAVPWSPNQTFHSLILRAQKDIFKCRRAVKHHSFIFWSIWNSIVGTHANQSVTTALYTVGKLTGKIP